MKINQNRSGFKGLILGLIVIAASVNVLAQDGETITLNKAVKLGSSANVELNLYDLKAVVMPSSKNEIRIELDYIATGKEEEVKRLKALMASSILKGASGSSDATVELTFQKNFDLEIMGKRWSKVTFNSDKKETIKLKNFKIMRCEIWLPSTANVSLDAKYSQLRFDDVLKGNFELDLYDGQLQLKDVTGYLKGDAKYSQIKGGSFSDIDLDIYECEVSVGNTTTCNLDAKYSTIKVGETQRLILDIYEGGLSGIRAEKAQIKNKYASININELAELKLDAYEGGLEVGKMQELTLSAKYLEVSLGHVEDFRMNEGYENEISIEKVKRLVSRNGKYNEFSIGSLGQALIHSGYEDEIEIENIASDFLKIELSGKYIEAGLVFINPPPYVLAGKIQYPGIDIKESDYEIRRKIGDDNHLEFLYEFGTVKESSSIINIEGYEMDISIQN
ncbi:hypothetical protein [Carboxylicivirga marina]|uniref:Adhesin domain-containing protein n=1 Tax=Carboxylicivirga marina TaxID=2800988 RepID=A0ABS1HH68_9BACT|nr:hypothetical protein [Carboxylicivirga marina]MBK3516544.1 hypothetical protein [Carboxylicivirga marina]